MLVQTDQWGLYHVGDQAFASKLEAIQYQRQCGAALHWRFQEDQFAQHDWTQEPQETLWDLYTERAHQLRNQYRYIILLYSGGADSENVLQAFERNGIMVDEIRIGYAGDWNNPDSLQTFSNLELHHVAIPRAQALQKQWPNLKVSVVSMDHMIMDSLQEYTSDNLHYGHNMGWSLWQRQRFGMTLKHSASWHPTSSKDQSVALLWGKDKTFVNLVQGRYAVQFMDRHLNGSLEPLPDNCVHEYFYWSPNSTRILIKQGHILKNFYRQADCIPSWFEDNRKFLLQKIDWKWHYNTTQVGGHTAMINNGCYNTLIYPHYNASTFDVGKIEWQTVSQSMKIMLKQTPSMNAHFENYMQACKDLYGADWVGGADPMAYGPKGIWSKPWFLEA